MSSNFIPILPTSPPPLAEDESSEDDFGDFTSAYDNSSTEQWSKKLSSCEEENWTPIHKNQEVLRNGGTECKVTGKISCPKDDHLKDEDIPPSIKDGNLEKLPSCLDSSQTSVIALKTTLSLSENNEDQQSVSNSERNSPSVSFNNENGFSGISSENNSVSFQNDETNDITSLSPSSIIINEIQDKLEYITKETPSLEFTCPEIPTSSGNCKSTASNEDVLYLTAECDSSFETFQYFNEQTPEVSTENKTVSDVSEIEESFNTRLYFNNEEPVHNHEVNINADLEKDIKCSYNDESNQKEENFSDDEFCDFAQADSIITSPKNAIISCKEETDLFENANLNRNDVPEEDVKYFNGPELTLSNNCNSDTKLDYSTLENTSTEQLVFSSPEALKTFESEKSFSKLNENNTEEVEYDVEDLNFEPFVAASDEAVDIPELNVVGSLQGSDEEVNKIKEASGFNDDDDDDEFADFSGFQNNAENISDDDFADFESATVDSTPEGTADTKSVGLAKLHLSHQSAEQILNCCFPECSPRTLDDEVQSLDDVMYIPEDYVPTNPKGKCVWADLYDTEKTPALQYHWNSSRCNKKLLTALNVDARNILQMLTPRLIGQFQDIPTTGQFQETIPPAQFDWSSSGLTNPLDDASNSMLTLLDLEYFSTLEEGNRQTVHSRISCLETELLSKTEGQPSIQKNQLLEQIMISGGYSSQQPRLSSPLDSEVRAILGKLPNLNFMQAKVLMFPVRASSPT